MQYGSLQYQLECLSVAVLVPSYFELPAFDKLFHQCMIQAVIYLPEGVAAFQSGTIHRPETLANTGHSSSN